MRDLHKRITFRNPESLIGALVLDAIYLSDEVDVVKVNDLEVIIRIEDVKASESFVNRLSYEFEFAPFFYYVNREQDESKYAEVHIHTNDKYFYRYNYHLTYEFHAFDKIIESVSEKLNPLVEQEIDDFLVNIGFIREKSIDIKDFYRDREWNIEYNKVVLALDLFEDETRFVLFSRYVYYSIATWCISYQHAQLIWENKTLWIEKYKPNSSN